MLRNHIGERQKKSEMCRYKITKHTGLTCNGGERQERTKANKMYALLVKLRICSYFKITALSMMSAINFNPLKSVCVTARGEQAGHHGSAAGRTRRPSFA